MNKNAYKHNMDRTFVPSCILQRRHDDILGRTFENMTFEDETFADGQ
jgi:hypothetical protein